MSKKTIYILIGGAVLLIAVLLVLSKTGVIGNKDKAKSVETSLVKATTIVETVSATGKIQPEIEVKIASMVSGEIIALPIKEGQVVKKGDLLVKINPDLYTSGLNRSAANLSAAKSGLTQAEAQFKEAKANYDRNKTLFEKGIISKSDWDKTVASFEVAKATKQSTYFNVQSANVTVKEAKDTKTRTSEIEAKNIELLKSVQLFDGYTLPFEDKSFGDDLPKIEIKKSDLNNGITFNDLIIKINFAKSNGEYRRNIANKGYRINNEIVTDEKKIVTKEDFNGEKVIKISFGKKQHVLIETI